MISNRPMIPMLTHVDNLGDLNLDMSTQEQSLQQIADNTNTTNSRLGELVQRQDQTGVIVNDISGDVSGISIKTGNLLSSVGLPADESTANTVIGLLKSISNKL